MELLRRHTDYALRAMVCLAQPHVEQDHLSVRSISEQADIPYPIACKLMQKLSRAGIVQSVLGLNGGYALTRPPDKISVSDVIEAIQGPLQLNKCIKTDTPCPKHVDCAVHPLLVDIQHMLDSRLQNTTLEELANGQK